MEPGLLHGSVCFAHGVEPPACRRSQVNPVGPKSFRQSSLFSHFVPRSHFLSHPCHIPSSHFVIEVQQHSSDERDAAGVAGRATRSSEMTEIVLSIDIFRRPEDVFSYVTDPRAFQSGRRASCRYAERAILVLYSRRAREPSSPGESVLGSSQSPWR